MIAIQSGAKGPNFAVVQRLRDRRARARRGRRDDPARRRRRDDRRRRRGADHAHRPGRVRLDARALARATTSPTRASRPFDAERDGFVLAEAAGMLVLESAGARPRSAARTSTPSWRATARPPTRYHITAPERGRRGRRARDAARALASAGLEPTDDRLRQRPRHLDAAQRPHRDPGDQAGVRRPRRPPVSSTKSMTGHLHRRQRRGRGDRLPQDDPRRLPAADDQPGAPRSRLRPGLHPERRARGAQSTPRCPTPSGSAATTRPSSSQRFEA